MLWIEIIIIIIIIAVFILILFLLNFYRDPERRIPKGSNITSPADGKIISIIDTSKIDTSKIGTSKSPIKIEKGLFGKVKALTQDISDNCYAISIFMSPLDVHINRAPIDGIVKHTRHTRGRFFAAYDIGKSLQNEKNEIIIQNKNMKIKVIQIAGFLARRIKCYVRKNQKINKGDRIGMIALGSQVTLIIPIIPKIIPRGVELKVKAGDKVKAGETIMAILGDK